MKTNYFKLVQTIFLFSFIFCGCSKEDAFYEDSRGNVITPETAKHPITGKKSFQCTKYFSTGNVWETYGFETVVSPTPFGNLFVIGQINLDSYGKSGQKIENNSSFVVDEVGNLSSDDLNSSYGNTFRLNGKYNATTNKIRMTFINIEGGPYCDCEEK
jgi:hypothetical protein